MNGDRAGRGTVQRPVSEFRIAMAGAMGLEPAAYCVTGINCKRRRIILLGERQ